MNKNYISPLKEILAAGSMTQSQLAERLEVTFAALNRWLHGHARPQPRRIVAIQKLHKELVGHPSVTHKHVQEAMGRAKRFKRRGLWALIAGHQALQEDLLLEHTYNSTSIEGTTFSKRQTEAVLFAKALIADKTLVEHLEVINHAAVLKGIFQIKCAEPITEAFIQNLHKDLMQGVRDDAGHYSKYPRAIRGVNIALTHPEDIAEKMANLIRSFRKKPVHKTIDDIADFHVQFEHIHPFGDGNGRIGRLLMAMQCLQENYPPVVIENARKADYYDVLEYAQRKSNAPFVCFLAEEMERTAKIIRVHLVPGTKCTANRLNRPASA